MTQKKKTDFKIVTPPDDLSEVRAKTKKIHREKLKKIVVPVILIALAVSGTYLMLTNKAYSEAGTAVRYSTDSSDTSNYAHFANGTLPAAANPAATPIILLSAIPQLMKRSGYAA